jgi:hypothetical protein
LVKKLEAQLTENRNAFEERIKREIEEAQTWKGKYISLQTLYEGA